MADRESRRAARETIERVFRDESTAILASLIRTCGDFDLAEDAMHDAFTAALDSWGMDGIPARPGAWITTAARRKAIDRLRRDQTFRRKQTALEALIRSKGLDPPPAPAVEEQSRFGQDDRLRLIFTCCHPALSIEAQVALTLRTIAGLSTPEIARAFLVRYSATAGDVLVRSDLCVEAIRLARLVRQLMPGEPEAAGLLALMLLHHSRRAARTDAEGRLVTLEEQDRARWDRATLGEGLRILDRAILQRRPGPFQIQAAIAGLHAQAERPEDTDWRQIALLYGRLLTFNPSPIVQLNRAAAVAMADGVSTGLRLLDELALSGVLEQYHLLHAARADLLRRDNRPGEAADAYRKAIAVCTNPVERRYLERRLRQLVG